MKRNDETQEEYEARIAEYNERKEARIDRFEELAGKHEQRSNDRYQTAIKATSGIPMGQPILIGHHSEKRHRAALRRSDNNMRKSIEHQKTAKHYVNRADAARHNRAINAADPEAVEKLQRKIEAAEHEQAFMKAANKIAKSKRKSYTNEQKIADLVSKLNMSELSAGKLLEPDFAGRVGFAGYLLTNINANIKRMKTRLKGLIAQAEMVHKRDPIADGVEYEEDPADARLRLYFPGKPSADMIKLLKSNGFKWSRLNQAWQRQLTRNAQYTAQQLLPAIIAEYGEVQKTRPIFSWGSTIMTPKVQAILPSVDLVQLLERHVSGDWGDIDEADKARNDEALKSRHQLLSVYKTPASPEGEIWVMTEANRAVTTFLLPSEK